MSWSFANDILTQANETTQNITGVANASPGCTFAVAGHGYSVGDLVQIDGTSDYDGLHRISSVFSTEVFTIVDLEFVSTQTGTIARGDGDLSGLASLTGVTVSGSVYTIDGTRKIVVTGALTLVPEDNILQFENGASSSAYPRMAVNDDAYFRFGSRSVVGDTIVYSKGVGLIVLGSGGTIWDTGLNGAFATSAGNPTLEFFGGVMVLGKPISFGGLNRQGSSNDYLSTGPVTIEELTVRMTSDGQIRFDNDEAAVMRVSNVRFHGRNNILLFAERFTTFSAIFDNTILQSYGGQLTALRFDDLLLLNNQADDDMQVNRGGEVLLFVNSDKGSSASVSIKNTTDCHLAFFGTALIEALDQDGAALEDIKYRIVDTVRANRVSPIGTFATDFADLAIPYGVSTATVYSGTTDSDGEAAPDILMSTYSADSSESTRRSDYSNGGSLGDSFDIKMFGYGTMYSLQSVVLRTRGGTPVPFFLATDESISESDKAVVDAYTELDTSAKAYDRLKAYLYDNYAGETEVLVTRSGDTLDFGSRNVILSRTASDVVAIDSSGNITLKTSEIFTGGLRTTGTITLSGTTINGPYQDSSGKRIRIKGLPAAHEGVAGAWPQSDGEDRSNMIRDSVPRIRRNDISMDGDTSTVSTVAGDFSIFIVDDDVKLTRFENDENNGTFTVDSIADDGLSMVLSRGSGSFVDEDAGNNVSIIDVETTEITLLLTADTPYFLVADAVSYLRFYSDKF